MSLGIAGRLAARRVRPEHTKSVRIEPPIRSIELLCSCGRTWGATLRWHALETRWTVEPSACPPCAEERRSAKALARAPRVKETTR